MHVKVELKAQGSGIPVGEIGIVVDGFYSGRPVIHGSDIHDVWVVLTPSCGTYTRICMDPGFKVRPLAAGESITITPEKP
jgi:hypothetical protein